MEHLERIEESNHNNCYWQYMYKPLSYEKLTTDINTEVVVTGEGLAAVSVAYNLVRSGKKVVLVAEKTLGTSGAGRTNSHLLTAVDERYHRLERIFGQETTRLIADSHKKAIDHIERTVAELNVDCEFERLDGFLFLHPSDDRSSLSKELKAARTAGVSVTDLPFVLGTNKHVPCLKFHDQAQFHPVKYMKGLCDAFVRAGGKIYTNTGISKIDRNGIMTRTGHLVSAKHIVVTGKEDEKHHPYQTYTIAARIKKGSVRKFLWWDTGNKKESRNSSPYHYVRIQRYDQDHDLLICGGQSHPKALTKVDPRERYVLLEAWMRERFPVADVIYRWSGDGYEPSNHVGMIGKKPGFENIYVVQGDSGHGTMNATIAGLLIPDLINGKENVWSKVYDPSQSVPSKLQVVIRNFFKESVSYLRNKMGSLRTEVDMKIDNIGSIQSREVTKEDLGTDGLHASGPIFWNNDEESWDRLQQKRKLIYNQKS